MDKLKHWCGVPGISGLLSSWVLEFPITWAHASVADYNNGVVEIIVDALRGRQHRAGRAAFSQHLFDSGSILGPSTRYILMIDTKRGHNLKIARNLQKGRSQAVRLTKAPQRRATAPHWTSF